MSLSQEERVIVVGLELEKADKFLAQAEAVAALISRTKKPKAFALGFFIKSK